VDLLRQEFFIRPPHRSGDRLRRAADLPRPEMVSYSSARPPLPGDSPFKRGWRNAASRIRGFLCGSSRDCRPRGLLATARVQFGDGPRDNSTRGHAFPPLPGSQRTARHVLYPFTPTSVSIRTYGVIPTASRARTHFGTETRNCHSKVPAGLHSYRGNYEDLAIGSEHGYSVKVRDFINLLRSTSTRAARANNSEEL